MIAHQLLKSGILQFGYFVTEDNQARCYRLRLEMLAAYPQLLQTVVYRGVQSLSQVKAHDRLVCQLSSIPLATALSLNTGTSLVYSRGKNLPAVHDLVGAYDIGHPTCLIVNHITATTSDFIARCRAVGLDIHSVLELVALGQSLPDIQQHAIFTLPAIIHELDRANSIPSALIQTIQDEMTT